MATADIGQQNAAGADASGGSAPTTAATDDFPVDIMSSPVRILLHTARYLEEEASALLQLCLLPRRIMLARLKADPEARLRLARLAILDNSPSFEQLDQARLRTIHAHYQMTILALLETALDQSEERLTDRQSAEITLHIGRVGLSLLKGILADKDRRARHERSKLAMALHSKREADPLPPSDERTPKRQKLAEMRRSSSMRADAPPRLAQSSSSSSIDDVGGASGPEAQDKHSRAILRRTELAVAKGVQLSRNAVQRSRPADTSENAQRLKLLDWELRITELKLTHLQGSQKLALKQVKEHAQTLRRDMTLSPTFYRLMLLAAEWENEEGGRGTSAALDALQDLAESARARGDRDVVLVAVAARTRAAMAAMHIASIPGALDAFCQELAIPALINHSQLSGVASPTAQEQSADYATSTLRLDVASKSLLHRHILLQYLIMRMLWDTRLGNRSAATALLAEYLRLMDEGVLDDWAAQRDRTSLPVSCSVGDGSINFMLAVSPLNVLVAMSYPLACIVKGNVAERLPKRRRYGRVGLAALETWNAGGCWEGPFSQGGWEDGLGESSRLEGVLAVCHADLLLDQAFLATYRGEFDLADRHMHALLDDLHDCQLFPSYAPKLLLLQGHRLQMLGRPSEATQAIEAARFLCNPGSEFDACLELCLLQLEIARAPTQDVAQLQQKAQQMAQAHPRGTNALSYDTLMLILQATTIDKINGAKAILKQILSVTTSSADHQARTLALAVGGVQYQQTRVDVALKVLQSCMDNARLLGPQPKDHNAEVGHARLGLWVSNRLEDIHRRMEKHDLLKRQLQISRHHQVAIEQQIGVA